MMTPVLLELLESGLALLEVEEVLELLELEGTLELDGI